jgi:transposase
LLRIIDGRVDFGFVREELKDFYSPRGRPSIDPEVLLRLLLVGYLYGITSGRRLMEEVRMHLAYRWLTRLGFEQELPEHSTFSKTRHGRFRQSSVFRKVLSLSMIATPIRYVYYLWHGVELIGQCRRSPESILE